MDSIGTWDVGVFRDPQDETTDTGDEVTLVDEKDMPSSSRSMSLLLDEALAAMDKYPESGGETK